MFGFRPNIPYLGAGAQSQVPQFQYGGGAQQALPPQYGAPQQTPQGIPPGLQQLLANPQILAHLQQLRGFGQQPGFGQSGFGQQSPAFGRPIMGTQPIQAGAYSLR